MSDKPPLTADELKSARDLVGDMEECVRDDVYFEIEGRNLDALARYIRELEAALNRHARYTDDGLRILRP